MRVISDADARIESVLALALGIFLAAHASTANDWLIVPGRRAGPITAKTTHADLVRIFGSENVTDEGPEDMGEGDFERVTVLNKKRPSMSAIILWTDGNPQKRVSQIRFCTESENCYWHTRQHTTLGTSLKRLEKLNGRPFTLSGFDWEYGGTAGFYKGRLSEFTSRCGFLILRLAPANPKPTETERWTQLIDQVEGDREFSSAHPAMQELDPKVRQLEMDFSDCKNYP